jgi:F-type H+-transporting ATPase subunit alpha
VISITDGQIFLESDLFYAGIRPAISVGRSVSRVGGAAQVKMMRQVAGSLRLDLSQYRELAAFAQFGADLDRQTQARLGRGERMYEILKQEQYKPLPVEEQAISLYMAVNGYVDSIATADVVRFEREFLDFLRKEHAEILSELRSIKELTEEIETSLKKLIVEFKKDFVS